MIGLTLNLETMTVTNKYGENKKLVKAKINDRFDRPRSESEYKNSSIYQFAIKLDREEQQDNTFQEEAKAFGYKWSEQVKGDYLALPSVEEMLVGIYTWLNTQLAERFQNEEFTK